VSRLSALPTSQAARGAGWKRQGPAKIEQQGKGKGRAERREGERGKLFRNCPFLDWNAGSALSLSSPHPSFRRPPSPSPVPLPLSHPYSHRGEMELCGKNGIFYFARLALCARMRRVLSI